MARKRTKRVLVLCLLALAAFGGYMLYVQYGGKVERIVDVVRD